ncbi:thyrostimulin beta-5 subunit [Drosophila kikkawai]|uniref:Thyrostimulin beta-5 subunit n=1 Tax=Drosophila kikkawai TaxID=30033 RepID=A0A6P4JNV6_DROKI|nr:thyrostimulin beta-5 subunit [Drosophila kikkawai]
MMAGYAAVTLSYLFAGVLIMFGVSGSKLVELEPINSGPTVAPLGCHRRLYTYKVTQTDIQGNECWDYVSVWSCWGRCDSSEISDWKFPYKRSFHPVCVHAKRQPAVAILKNCHSEADESISKYHYMEAVNCHCQTCSTQDTSCEAPANTVMDGGSKAIIIGAHSEDLDY